MRDRLMSEEYFREFIAEERARITKFSTKLKAGEIRADRVFSIEHKIHSIKFGIFIARYSMGEELPVLRDGFGEILEEFPRFWGKTSSYVDLVWVMSIAVMLKAGPEQFAPLAELLDRYQRHDALLDFFSDYVLKGTISLENPVFTCPKPYGELGKIITEQEDRTARLKNYLEKKWYPGHKQFGIRDVHKAKEKLYSGYWSFESGAVAKILGLDDSSLREVLYYPYDLAHFED